MKKFFIALSVIIGFGLLAYVGNVGLKVVGNALGSKIIKSIPDKFQYFTADQQTFVDQLAGKWAPEKGLEPSEPILIRTTNEDLTISQVDRNNFVYPAKHIEINGPVATFFNLGTKPNLDITIIDQNTLSFPDLNATNETEETAAITWKRTNN